MLEVCRQATMYIAHNPGLIGAALGGLLRRDERLTVRGEVTTADDLVRLFRREPTAAVVIQANLRGPSVQGALREIHYRSPGTRIVIIVERATDRVNIEDDMRATIVHEFNGPEALFRAILHAGVHPRRPTLDKPHHPLLTRRQIEVLQLVADGHSNMQIGLLLQLSSATVKRHLAGAFYRLGARSRTDAIVRASHEGLLRPI